LATYSYDNFIKTPVEGDRKLEIYDSGGNLRYMLEPIDVNFFYKNNNVIVHHLRTNIERQPSRDHAYVILDFDSEIIAQSAELKANDAKNLILSFNNYYTIGEIDQMIDNLSATTVQYFNSTGFTENLIQSTAFTNIFLTEEFTDVFLGNTSFTNSVVSYTNENPTLVTTGGIRVGTIFSAVTMQEMWSSLLYPEFDPYFSTFTIPALTTVDVGYIITGNVSFTWTLLNPTLTRPDSIYIYDTTRSLTLLSGISSGTTVASISLSGLTKNSYTSNVFNIYGRKRTNMLFTASDSIIWAWRGFFGSSTATTLTSGDTSAFSNYFFTTVSKTYSFTGSGYKYIIIPNFLDITTFRDSSTNLNVAMAGIEDGYTSAGVSNYYLPMTIVNAYGKSTTYRVYRTKNNLGGSINIVTT